MLAWLMACLHCHSQTAWLGQPLFCNYLSCKRMPVNCETWRSSSTSKLKALRRSIAKPEGHSFTGGLLQATAESPYKGSLPASRQGQPPQQVVGTGADSSDINSGRWHAELHQSFSCDDKCETGCFHAFSRCKVITPHYHLHGLAFRFLLCIHLLSETTVSVTNKSALTGYFVRQNGKLHSR